MRVGRRILPRSEAVIGTTDSHDSNGELSRRGHVLVATALTMAVAIAAFFVLGRRPLAGDEATSYFIAQLDWPRLWQSLATSEANGSLFYVILHWWTRMGDSEVALRILPVAFAVATIPALYAFAADLFGVKQAVASCLLLGANAFFISHAQELRSYSLATFLVTVSSVLFVKLIRNASFWKCSGYVVVSALAIYAHFFSMFVLAAHAMSVVFLKWRIIPLKVLLTAYLSIGVLIGPLVYFVLFNDVGQVDWIAPPNLSRLKTILHDLAGMAGTWLLLLYAALCAGTFIFGLRAGIKQGRSFETWKHALVAFWLLFPILGGYGVSLVKPLLVSRYLLVCLPGLATCAALTISSVRYKLVYGVALVAVLGLASTGLFEWYRGSTGVGWSARAEYVASRAGADDAIVFYAPTVVRPFGYYAGYYGSSPLRDIHPKVIYPSIDWLGYSARKYHPDFRGIDQRTAKHERVWLVTGYARDRPRRREMDRMRAVLARRCGTVVERSFNGTVILYGQCSRT